MEPTVMSAEELWALVGDDDVEQFRGPDVEITGFEHKQARDFAQFAQLVQQTGNPNNTVRVHSSEVPDEDDDEFQFDVVQSVKE
jgi:hypothetical protein